jgi:hypothetical protein
MTNRGAERDSKIGSAAVVLLAANRRLPRALRGLDIVDLDAVATSRRVIVVGSHADLAAVLTRLLKENRLDVEVAHVPSWRSARRARRGVARRVPLIRDDTGTVITQAAFWLPPSDDVPAVTGEAIVDDTALFDGQIAGVRIEPTANLPGLRASTLSRRQRPQRWIAGRAAQLGTTGAAVVRDGVTAKRPVRRSTFYRHVQGWLRVG